MRFRGVVVLFGALVAWPAAAPAAPKRPITETDLYAFQWVAAPQISPDGRQAAYVLVTVNEKRDGYDTSLWIVPTSGAAAPRRLTAGPRDSAPRWSPDGRTLAFLRSPGEKEKPQIFLLPLDGGEARALTDLPGGASTPVWSPSGKAIAFTSGTNAEDLEAQRLAKEKDKAAPRPDKSDVHVVTRAVFRQNGEGWLDFTRPDHVWTVPVTAGADGPGQARQITSGVFIEADPVWSADGSAILFRSDRNLEPYYDPPDANLYSVPAAGGPIETVADIAGPIQQAVPAPDGKSFALIGFVNPPQAQSYTRSDVLLYAGGKVVALTAGGDFTIGSEVTGDQHPPRGGSRTPLVWTPDGRSVLLVTTLHGRSNLVRLDVATRRIEPLTEGNHEVFSTSATPDGSKMVLEIGDPTHPGDLYAFDVATRRLAQLTRHNDPLFAELDLADPRGALVHELRRHEDQRLAAQAARVRSRPEVPADPRDPRRPARRVRRRVLPRVPVDGRPRVPRPLHQPARLDDLRAGLRKHHPVPLPGRRLQGPDGRRGRSGPARLRRRIEARCDGRLRRRPPDQLGRDADQPVRGRRFLALGGRLGVLLVHGGLHALPADVVPDVPLPGSRGVLRALARALSPKRSRRRSCSRSGSATTARRPGRAPSRCSARSRP